MQIYHKLGLVGEFILLQFKPQTVLIEPIVKSVFILIITRFGGVMMKWNVCTHCTSGAGFSREVL